MLGDETQAFGDQIKASLRPDLEEPCERARFHQVTVPPQPGDARALRTARSVQDLLWRAAAADYVRGASRSDRGPRFEQESVVT